MANMTITSVALGTNTSMPLVLGEPNLFLVNQSFQNTSSLQNTSLPPQVLREIENYESDQELGPLDKLVNWVYNSLNPAAEQQTSDSETTKNYMDAIKLTEESEALISEHRYEEALAKERQAVSYFERYSKPDSQELVASLVILGDIHNRLNNDDEALAIFKRAYDISKKFPDSNEHLSVCINISHVYFKIATTLSKNRSESKEIYLRAVDFAQEAVDVALRRGEDQHAAGCFDLLAVNLAVIGDCEKSFQAYQQAMKLYRSHGEKYLSDLAKNLRRIGEFCFDQGDITHIKQLIEYRIEAIGIYEKIGKALDDDTVVSIMDDLAHIYFVDEQVELAREVLLDIFPLIPKGDLTKKVKLIQQLEAVDFYLSLDKEGREMLRNI